MLLISNTYIFDEFPKAAAKRFHGSFKIFVLDRFKHLPVNQDPKIVVQKARDQMMRNIENFLALDTSEYIFFGENISKFDMRDHDIERLIREAEIQGLEVVGGSTRFSNGHWTDNCGQISVKNSSINIKAGYYHSRNSCWLCSFVDGPFIIRKTAFSRIETGFYSRLSMFTKELDSSSYIQFPNSAICPDMMFHSNENLKDSLSDYRALIIKFG